MSVGMDLAAIGKRLRTQDNLATADPIFTVQQRNRLYSSGAGRPGDRKRVTIVMYRSIRDARVASWGRRTRC